MKRMRPKIDRAFLAGLTVVLLCAGIVVSPACGRRAPALKHVILFIGDGMSAESEVAASRYLYGTDDGLAWQKLPAKAYVATWDVNVYNGNARKAHRPPYSRSSFAPLLGYDVKTDGPRPHTDRDSGHPFPPGPATDSASAATALATGFKTDSGNISWLPGDPPDGQLTTIAEEYRARTGAGIGVVSTVPFDHATPAAFVSHNTSRNSYYTGLKGYKGLGIADEIIQRVKPDVVIGGGHPLLDNPDFNPKRGCISESLYLGLKTSPDYLLVERIPGGDGGRAIVDGAAAARRAGKKLFGLFGGKGGGFEVPLAEDAPGRPRVIPGNKENPTLAEATLAALDYLSGNPDGFFLMVEQGDIDWANHDNDFRGMIGCVADLDGAVRAATAFVDRPGDAVDWTNTVLLVTADHATGGLVLDNAKHLGLGDLPRQEPRVAYPEAPPPAGSDRGVAPNGVTLKTPVFTSPNVYPDEDVSYGTAGHANELVDLAVAGAAARYFLKYRGTWYPGLIIDNTQINAALREALGLSALGRHAVRGS
ncbi:MAG: alkaline phosphatase [Candidatus Aminicenantes bacterium]|nr:alkaline phosphatase [Candidatus Aminicenantes bacterium]